jgi:hypothetical protein
MTTPLLERLGLAAAAPPAEPMLERLARTAERVWERLGADGRRHPAARVPRLHIAPGYLEVLQAAVALEEVEPEAGSAARVANLQAHYLELMPSYRVEQLATSDPPNDFVFHAPLEWARLPRLVGGLERTFALLEAAGVPAERALGAPTVEAWTRRYETLAALYEDTYFGSFLPFLYGFPQDLAAYRRELAGGGDPWAVFDRRLAAPILHELMHFRHERELGFPPVLDECVAGYLGVHLFPTFAYPEPGEDNALYCSPWFAQVGQALVRAVGLEAVVRAQTGTEPWREAMAPALVDAAERFGWGQYRRSREVHFLIGNTRPEPWIKLFYLAVAGALPEVLDEEALAGISFAEIPLPPEAGEPGEVAEIERRMLHDALRAMCLRNFQDGGSYRVESVVPPGPVTLDFETGVCRRESGADSLDLAPPRYTLPPSLAARCRALGWPRAVLVMRELAALGGAVDALVEGGEGREGGPARGGAEGFELAWEAKAP